MLPGEFEIPLYRGDTYVMEGVLNRLDSFDGEDGPLYVVVDLTGCQLDAQIRLKPNADILAVMEAEIVGDPTLGGFRLTLPAEESAKVFRDSVWDFQTTFPDGVVQTWIGGPVTLKLDTTRIEDEA